MVEVIKREVERIISESIDKEIKDRTIAFHKELTERKDQYIAEVMSGIRIAHEYNPKDMYMDYRIMFINRYVAEPQTEIKGVGYCNECKWFKNKQVCGRCRSKNLFAEADAPQTERSE